MHYMNGRPAQNGDIVVHISPYDGKVTTGVLYNAKAGNDYCNGSFAPLTGGSHYCPNLAECVLLKDFKAILPLDVPIADSE